MSKNHFISVSKQGILWARRKGCKPVQVAEAEKGLRITPRRWFPGAVVVHFEHGGTTREVCVTGVQVGDTAFEMEDFQTRFSVSDEELGAWMRDAVEEALDGAGSALD